MTRASVFGGLWALPCSSSASADRRMRPTREAFPSEAIQGAMAALDSRPPEK